MISLFLDTSYSRLVLSVIDEEKNKILSVHDELLKDKASEEIFGVLTSVIKDAKVIPSKLNKIYVVNGPGSFTGIRIGVTIAKTYAWTLDIPIVPISSLEVLASSLDDNYIVSVIDARRESVYAGIYDSELNVIMKDQYISLEKLKEQINGNDYKVVSDDNLSFFNEIEKPNIDILKIINKHKKDKGVNPHQLNPNYLKDTEAETKLGKND